MYFALSAFTGPKILLYTFLSKMFVFYLYLLVSRFLMHMLKFCLLLCSLVLVLFLFLFFVHFITSTEVLHVLALGCHRQGVVE